MDSGPSTLLDTGDIQQETIPPLKEVIVNQKGEGSSQRHKINTVIIWEHQIYSTIYRKLK